MPIRPKQESTMEAGMGKRQGDIKYWWDDLPEPAKITIPPTEEEAAAQLKENHTKRGFILILASILIRIYCFAIGALMVAYGGWVLYAIHTDFQPLSVVSSVAAGCFLIIAGLMTVLVECRTRRTMERCLGTYIILSNHFARGLFYLVVGALTFPINVTIPYIGDFGSSRVLAGFMAAGGVMNLIFAPFYYRYMRRKEQSKIVRGPGNAEEIAYELDMQPAPKKSAPPESEVYLASSQDFDEDGLDDEEDEENTTVVDPTNGDLSSSFQNVALGDKVPKKHDKTGRKRGPDIEAIRSSLDSSLHMSNPHMSPKP